MSNWDRKPMLLFGWTVGGEDVTCLNCLMPVYRPKKSQLCPACEEALAADVKAARVVA